MVIVYSPGVWCGGAQYDSLFRVSDCEAHNGCLAPVLCYLESVRVYCEYCCEQPCVFVSNV